MAKQTKTAKLESKAKPRPPTKPGSPERREIADKVLAGMRSGLSALKACEAAGIPQCTFSAWVDADANLAKEYARAREELIERMAQEVLELSDLDVGLQPDGKKDWGAVQKHKLQVDTRKWLLSKLAPKKYGDRLEIAGDSKNPLEIKATIDVAKLSTTALAEIMAAKDATDAG